MGRPPKRNLNYSTWDVDVLENDTSIDNLIDAQGPAGFYVYFALCQKAYATDGYFYRWGYGNAASTARKLGGGLKSTQVRAIVDLCVSLGLFDKALFTTDGILTSRAIQSRYLDGIARRTGEIPIIVEYWLLEVTPRAGLVFVHKNGKTAWLTFEQLNNTATFDVRQLRPRYGIGGADFSSTTDLTAAVVIFMVPGDPHIYVLCMFWLPEELLERRVREDRIPYDLWKEQGYLRTCEGNKVRQKDVTEWFLEVQNELDCYIYCGGYDAWSASYWVDEMQDTFGKGVFVPVQQTMKTLSLPMKQLGADFDSKLIIYNNNPVLKWCLANTGIVEDKNGNIKPNKTSKARKRIDGLAALLDAFVVFQDRQDDYKTMI